MSAGPSSASLHRAWLADMARRSAAFAAALADPQAAQRAALSRILSAGARSRHGEALGICGDEDLAAFQAKVPIATPAGRRALTARALEGEPDVAAPGPIRFFERTSGTTAASRLVPFNDALLGELRAGIDPWLGRLHGAVSSLLGRPAYWSISPVGRPPERSPGGVPIGPGDDRVFLGRPGAEAMASLGPVAAAVAGLADHDTWRLQTLTQLLAAEELALLSVWSPSFLSALMRGLEADLDRVLAALPRARARRVEAAVAIRGLTGRALWPRLALISAWADGAARPALSRLRRWFPETPVQPKGLLATEGIVSVPWAEGGVVDDPDLGPTLHSPRVAAITGHLIEFAPADGPPVLAHDVREGERYEVLLTTGGGLWRAPLGDQVRCTGFVQRTPTLRFEGRVGDTSDLVGEKLTGAQVAQALADVLGALGRALDLAVLAADQQAEPARYALVWDAVELDAAALRAIEARLGGCCERLDAALCANVHYAYARRLGQLGPVRAARLPGGLARYEARMLRRGMRRGDIKPPALWRPEVAAALMEDG